MHILTSIKLAVVTCTEGSTCTISGGYSGSLFDLFHVIANVLVFTAGAVAVIMIIIGGLRYALSAGNPSAIAGAKNTIVYALIGLIISSSALLLIKFVTDHLK